MRVSPIFNSATPAVAGALAIGWALSNRGLAIDGWTRQPGTLIATHPQGYVVRVYEDVAGWAACVEATAISAVREASK